MTDPDPVYYAPLGRSRRAPCTRAMDFLKCCFDSELPDFIESTLNKCTDPSCCCGCCSALRPRYKRLVDNIFPVDAQDGLVKNNMDKLTYYAVSSPEKLDRIGEYLLQRARRDVYRRRYGFATIAMEAMDQLLSACHGQAINLFVESYLKMVQNLLESSEHNLQVLATQSFVKFANIEEDTPSYHRRYDFFVSKFSSMCHFVTDGDELQNKIRLAGIKGLQGVVRKTVSDDLVENIWAPDHMNKIVPSLLYNMQDLADLKKGGTPQEETQEERIDPPDLAETCMRELVGRASFGHIRCVVKPVLKHLDNHNLWLSNQFAIHTFKVIMFSIQAQHSYAVVETLMAHLDENSKASPKIRTSVAEVLSKIIAIAAGESIGPSVLEIINSLLTHLRHSVMTEIPPEHRRDEKMYQEALINALGEFANHLPDYQKIEIMKFIMSKVPQFTDNSKKTGSNVAHALLQNILLKSLLKVGTKYRTVQFSTTFPMSFLEPLLRMSMAPDGDMRLLVQKILHTLIDRHHNIDKLQIPTVDIAEIGLVTEKCCQPDEIFVRKHGQEICSCLGQSFEEPSNTIEHISAIYTTLALYCVEIGCRENMMDLLRLLKNVQDTATTNSQLSTLQRCSLHAVVASLLTLIPFVLGVAPLQEYADQIITLRRQKAPHLLPPLRKRVEVPGSTSPGQLPSDMGIDLAVIIDILRSAGYDVTRLQAPFDAAGPRNSWVDSGTGRGSVGDLNLTIDEDSPASSPGIIRKAIDPQLTVEALKKMLNEPASIRKQEEEQYRQQLCMAYRMEPFKELVSRNKAKTDTLQNTLNDIFSMLVSDVQRAPHTPNLSLARQATRSSTDSFVDLTNNTPASAIDQPPSYEVLFPQLFHL